MIRATSCLLMLVTLSSALCRPAAAQTPDIPLISQEFAQQIGLKRAWVAQVPLDRARSKITHIKLQAGLLLVVTSENMLYTMDAESGKILWSFHINDHDLLALAPAANATNVAVATTERLFVLNRSTGDVVFNRRFGGTSEYGPIFTTHKVIVPLVKGLLESYPNADVPLERLTSAVNVISDANHVSEARADDNGTFGIGVAGTPPRSGQAPVTYNTYGRAPDVMVTAGQGVAYDKVMAEGRLLTPNFYQSAGRLEGAPASFDDLLVWAGDANLIMAHITDHKATPSLLVPDGVSTGPAIFPSPTADSANIFLGTVRGYLIGYDLIFDKDIFREMWQFAAGSPIRIRPIATDAAVYALPEDGGMYALKRSSGEKLWFAPDTAQFVAASALRLYTLDQFGVFTLLNPKSGARLMAVQFPRMLKMLTNDQNDRIVMYTDHGLIQCLHEPALVQPQLNLPPKPEAKKAPGTAPKATPAEGAPAAAGA
jgi:hypothetical protein